MKDLEVIVVEKLGGSVSYGRDKIRVLKEVFDQVPQEKQSEFIDLVKKSASKYFETVSDLKSKGEKVSPSAIKSACWKEVCGQFIQDNQVKRTVSRVVHPKPQTPKKAVKLVSKSEEIPIPFEELKEKFDNYPSELLNDDYSEEDKHQDEELGLDSIFNEGDLEDGSEEPDVQKALASLEDLDLDI